MKKLLTIFCVIAGLFAIWCWVNFGRALSSGRGAELLHLAKQSVATTPRAPSGWYGAYDSESHKTHTDLFSVWIGPEGVAKVKALIFNVPATWRLQNKMLFLDYTN